MSNIRVEKKIKEIIGEQLGINDSEIKPESTADTLGADSLDTIEILMAIEEEFDLEISDEEADKLTTVQDAIDYVGQFSR